MALEGLLVAALIEVPIQMLAFVLRRWFSVTPERAHRFAGRAFFALLLGACFLAWYL